MHAMQSTTLTCCLDDPVLTNSLAEFFLQIQSGLLQSSMKSSLSSPKGSIIMSTNLCYASSCYVVLQPSKNTLYTLTVKD